MLGCLLEKPYIASKTREQIKGRERKLAVPAMRRCRGMRGRTGARSTRLSMQRYVVAVVVVVVVAMAGLVTTRLVSNTYDPCPLTATPTRSTVSIRSRTRSIALVNSSYCRVSGRIAEGSRQGREEGGGRREEGGGRSHTGCGAS